MGEMDDKIKGLLSSPDAMNNILSLIKSMTGSGTGSDSQPEPNPEPSPGHYEAGGQVSPSLPAPAVSPAASPAFSAAKGPAVPASFDLSALSKLDPRIMTAAMQVLGEYTHDDDRIVLLNALKPHLKAERRERLDKAAQIVRITKSIRAALNGFTGGAKNV